MVMSVACVGIHPFISCIVAPFEGNFLLILAVFAKLLPHLKHTFPKGRESISEIPEILLKLTEREAKIFRNGC